MKRLMTCGLVGALASLLAASNVYAQQPGAGRTGQTPGGTTPASPGITAGTHSGQSPGGATPASPGVTAVTPYGSLNSNPWFANNSIQQQLNMNNQQTSQLNKMYSDQWSKYQQQLNSLPNNLNAQERSQRLNGLNQDFYNNFNTAASGVFSNPAQRARYEQLHRQYRNYGAFEDPAIQQKLNLNATQKNQLSQYQQAWNKQMQQIHRQYQTDPAAAAKQYQSLQQSAAQNINNVLTPQQQTSWRQFTGESFNFEPSTYFGNSSNSTTSGSPSTRTK